MGKIKQGILGGVSGTVGNVIGASWKGIDYIRIMPSSVADPKTDAQLTQRQRWSVAMAFLKPMITLLRLTYKLYAVQMSAFNAAMSEIVKDAITGSYPSFTLDYANALVAKGNLAPPLNAVATSTVAGTIDFVWDDNSDEENAAVTDPAILLVICPVKNQAVYVTGTAERGDAGVTITVPDSFSGLNVHAYVAFENLIHTGMSNSGYAGVVTVA